MPSERTKVMLAVLQKLAAGGMNTPAMQQSFVGNAFSDFHGRKTDTPDNDRHRADSRSGLIINGTLDVSSGLIISSDADIIRVSIDRPSKT